MSAPRDHLYAWEQLFRVWRAWYPVPVRVLIDRLIDLDCVNDPSKPLAHEHFGIPARTWRRLLKALREANDKLPAGTEPPVVVEPAGSGREKGKYRFTVRVTVPHDYNPKDMVAKLEAHRWRNRVARAHLDTSLHDALGYLTDQTIGMGKPIRPLPYPVIRKGNAPVRIGKSVWRDLVRRLKAKGVLAVDLRVRQDATYAVNTGWTPPGGGTARGQIPDLNRSDPGLEDPASRPDPGLARGQIPDPPNRPRELASTEKNMSLTNVAPEAARVAGVSDLSSEGSSKAPDGAAVRKRQRDRLRHVWDDAHAAADWRQPGLPVPAWTIREKKIAESFIDRLGNPDTAARFLAWNAEHWRAIHKHALAGLRCPASPSIRTIARYFDHLHGAWQRGTQREWLDLLPFEERRLAAKLAAGMTREAALLEIAEERARAKDRDERAAAEARVDDKLKTLAVAERDLVYARRRESMRRAAPVRTRTRPTILIKDASPGEIKRVLDEQMADFTPPDFDHDPYADPAAG
jgi:hypothetical protein